MLHIFQFKHVPTSPASNPHKTFRDLLYKEILSSGLEADMFFFPMWLQQMLKGTIPD